mmetsp:Transcript_1150/g.4885  ORF Transcript_1150/g.4885 Transcript_1150/m.4885 type:complete len:271 (+) Transcript_1150:339-1151(+)
MGRLRMRRVVQTFRICPSRAEIRWPRSSRRAETPSRGGTAPARAMTTRIATPSRARACRCRASLPTRCPVTRKTSTTRQICTWTPYRKARTCTCRAWRSDTRMIACRTRLLLSCQASFGRPIPARCLGRPPPAASKGPTSVHPASSPARRNSQRACCTGHRPPHLLPAGRPWKSGARRDRAASASSTPMSVRSQVLPARERARATAPAPAPPPAPPPTDEASGTFQGRALRHRRRPLPSRCAHLAPRTGRRIQPSPQAQVRQQLMSRCRP